MLRKIGLQNFKCWKELDIDLAPITLFFGSNSSGKTTILQSLLMLKQTARGFDPAQHINFGDDRDYVKLGSYRDLVYGHDNTKHLGVKLAWNTSTSIKSVFGSGEDSEIHERTLKSIALEVVWGIEEIIYVDELSYMVESIDAPTDFVKIRRGEDGHHWLTSSFSKDIDKPERVSSSGKVLRCPWRCEL